MVTSPIDDVIESMDAIILDSLKQKSRIGYFAALYHHVAVQFKVITEEHVFNQWKIMGDIDVAFFRRYLDALDQYRRGGKPSQSWQVAFDAAQSPEPIVLQHLLLGMNAHINFDLGIAVAQVCPLDRLGELYPDFLQMNDILASLLSDVMKDLTKVWPRLGLLNELASPVEDAIINFSMHAARESAWDFANKLARASEPERAALIAEHDVIVAALGQEIWKPAFPLSTIVDLVHATETRTVPETINILVNSCEHHLPDYQPSKRTRVAILGGGIGAMATAFELTDPANVQYQDYDVTVYQMGWRVGGKGASGRNARYGQRIEEHGLHIWFGFYENAFRVMQLCYAELNRAPDAPLANWQDAWKPQSFIAVEEQVGGKWRKWTTNFPTNDDVPGDGQALLPMWDYVVMGLNTMHEMFNNSPEAHANIEQPGIVPHGLGPILEHLVRELGVESLTLGGQLLTTAQHLAQWMSKDAEEFAAWLSRESNPVLKWMGDHLGSLLKDSEKNLTDMADHFINSLLQAFMDWYWDQVKDRVETDAPTRHRWVNLNLFYGNLRGIITDQLISRGFDSVNDLDYRAWLSKYVKADNGLTIGSPIVASVYNALFAYDDGDTRMEPGELYPKKANLEAGTALRSGIREFMTYKGAIMWKMQAGMGDVVFTPLYEVLKRRGVKFEFFHKVKQLIPSPDGKTIQRVVIARQVDIKPEQAAKGGYDPLVQVNGLACWPIEPFYDQLVDGDKLKENHVDLESYCYDWKDVEEITLEADKDFDAVVLGIPVGALPYLCGDLINASVKWRDMVNHVKTVRTEAFQLWLKPTAYDLGWTEMQQPVLTSFDVTHLNTWADMSHLIPHEAWSSDPYPLNIAYFCGPERDPVPPEPSPHGPIQSCEQMDQSAANDRAKQHGIAMLNNYIGDLWPRALTKDTTGQPCFNEDLLVDLHPEDHPGHPFDSQYWHGNVTPPERYTLSVAGSSKYRLPAHSDEEFTNLYLAGDWTQNGMNVGCVEAAVMSGMLAAHALSGYPAKLDIYGLKLDLP